jgi:heme exporter protein B
MSLWIQQIRAVLAKDLRIEARNPAVIYTMLLFACLVVVIFTFAFHVVDDHVRSYAPGIVWVAVLFTVSLGTGRIFDREAQNSCLDGLLMATVEPRVVFVAKTILANLFSLLMAGMVVPLVCLFFDLEVAYPGWLTISVFLGVFGFCLIGTLFGALMIRLPFREILFPLVVFPLVVPLFICGVKATGLIFDGGNLEQIQAWTGVMLAFDLVFVVGTHWIFPQIIRDRGR